MALSVLIFCLSVLTACPCLHVRDEVRQLIAADFLTGLTSWWQEALPTSKVTTGVGALVTASVLFHDEYVNVNRCSFSLGVTVVFTLIR